MSVCNKDLTRYPLLMILMILGLQCSHVKQKKVPDECRDYELEGSSFIVGDSLYANKLICFFTETCCPTCVLEVMTYSESIRACPKVLFCTNKVDTLNEIFYSIINPKVLKFTNNCLTHTKMPLLFQTDINGKIYNLLAVKYEEPFEVKKYFLKFETELGYKDN